MKRLLLLLTCTLALATWLRAEDPKPAAPAAKEAYPLTTCLVSGEKLGEMGEPYVIQYEGRTVKFCCKNCLKKFNKDPKKYLAKLDEAAKKNPAPAPAAPAPAAK